MKFNEYIQMINESDDRNGDFVANSFCLILDNGSRKKERICINLSKAISQNKISNVIDGVLEAVKPNYDTVELIKQLLKKFPGSTTPKEEPDFNFYITKHI